jgi:hypothetical protein
MRDERTPDDETARMNSFVLRVLGAMIGLLLVLVVLAVAAVEVLFG